MKRPSKIAVLLGLILAIGLGVVYSRKPVRETPSIALPPTARSDSKPLTAAGNEASPDNSQEKTRVSEGSWARELRELRALAATNPNAALTRVAQLSDKHERKSAARTVCLVVGARDPAKAMQAAWHFDLGRFSDEPFEYAALESLAKQWAEADLPKAVVWASALPGDDETRRDRVIKGIASALARVAPQEAARMVAQQIHPDSAVQVDAAMDVLRTWAAREYTAAVAWASLFPEGPLRERGIDELANVTPGPVPAAASN